MHLLIQRLTAKMGKVNSCFKLAFILLTVVFVVLTFIIIHVSVLAKANTYEVSGLNPIWLWVFILVLILIAILGIYAASTENAIMLKIFAALMIIIVIICLILGIVSTVIRKEQKDQFSKPKEFAKMFISEEKRNATDAFQKIAKCCGAMRAEDWGTNIPASCKCSSAGSDGQSKCKPRPQGTTGPDQIFSMPCKDQLYRIFVVPYSFAMGLFYFFVCLSLLILVLNFTIIRQIGPGSSHFA